MPSPMIEVSVAACEVAKLAAKTAPKFTGYVCCARVYIQQVGRLSAKSKRTLAAFGWKVMSRGRGTAIYVGYDNADGILYGKAIAMAAAFKANGFSCYEDTDMD